MARSTTIVPASEVEYVGDEAEYAPLSPCPNCGASPHESMKAAYQTEHCYACGYRPGNSVEDANLFRQQFEAFKRFQTEQVDALRGERGMSPPEVEGGGS